MGLNDLQSHFTQNIVNTVESVDLLKVAQTVKTKNRNDRGEQFKVIVDGECCLDRLYGGYFPDWICGGQWNKMEQFLRNFASVIQSSNLDLVICFNGALEPERLEQEWKIKQEETLKFIEEIHRHVTYKKKPPPKCWWVAPAYLRSAVRVTFRALQIRTMSTLEDHHKEIVRFCQKNNFHAIVADDPEYLVFDIPRYFSAQKLKLTFKGSLETVELKLKKVQDDLNLTPEKFHIFTALFGNYLLSESDLTCLYAALGVDSSSKTSLIEKIGEFIRTLESNDTDKVVEKIGKLTCESEPEKSKELCEKLGKCLQYYSDLSIPKAGVTSQKENKKSKGSKASKKSGEQNKVQQKQATPATLSDTNTGTSSVISNNVTDGSLPSDTQKLESGDSSKIFADTTDTEVTTSIPPVVNGSSGGGNGSGDTTSSNETNAKSSLDKLLYRVNSEIENVCITRHKNGLMSPYIYHILKHREIKLPVIIQESKDSKELPKAYELFRPLRQRVYAILFNLHHLHFLAKQRNEKTPPLYVKETYYCPITKGIKTDLVQAVEVGWGVPTVERLWLGDQEECKLKRTRAFLAILKSDKPVMLDPSFVPQQMLVLASVLRYILSTEKKVLRKSDLEAFIAQAFIQEMTDPSIAQDIEVTNLTMRGVHLAHLFMEGVEMSVLTNDACGAPIPYMLFSPWMFFNGKVFSYVLEQQTQGKSLAEICGYKMDLVFSIDQLRLAVTEGVKVQYAQAPNPAPFFGNNGPLLNHILAPPTRQLPYNIPNQMNLHNGGPGSLTQLAAAAAAANSRNRMLGPQSQNPFVLAAAAAAANNGGGGGAGIYGNYPHHPSTSIGGSGIHSRGVPIYRLDNDIPITARQQQAQHQVQQRRGVPPTRGGHLEVGGMVVGSWGANYGGLANPLMNGGRNVRVPMGPGGASTYPNHHHQNIQMNSLFDQMRISGGKAQNNYRPGGGAQNAGWNQRRNYTNHQGKNQKKPVNKKADNNIKSGTNNSSSSAKNDATNKPNNSKGVTFKDESQRLETPVVSESSNLSENNKGNTETN
ncbi:constitutive coactivator of PPAR-gamma-like protein 1 isoform X2 [Folsomia candida]|uniref:constitutive coactivator of PPAR-gamma-like protein 1 isoform X2 n=1 Tax=Folsomia candida TaxID=158441 RepID=UPI000B9031DE|nr:constitutive coactivator of PPAR-gamma-like protein 1 isoform X2 [Folsomia candida]